MATANPAMAAMAPNPLIVMMFPLWLTDECITSLNRQPGYTYVRFHCREEPAMDGPVRTYTWPALRVDDWTATRETLHMWTQIVGKVRLAHMPLINHWWQVTLYVSPRGLTTSTIPYGTAVFDMEFDFVDHVLAIRHSDGSNRAVPLVSKPVAEFYGETLSALDSLGIETKIVAHPNEVDPSIPFAEDYEHAEYDADAVRTFWQQLVQAHRVILEFRASFAGKVSPVHFFWGALDLA